MKQGWSPDYHPEIKVLKKTDHPSPAEGVGILETFTTLYATPEGFRSPLTIGYVKTDAGEMVMACNPDYLSPKELKMGKKVHLRTREGLYVFEKSTLWSRLKHRLKKQPKNN
jgi:uncharacterized OB-fold protein